MIRATNIELVLFAFAMSTLACKKPTTDSASESAAPAASEAMTRIAASPTVSLKDGLTLKLPPDALLVKELDPPPADNLVSAQVYRSQSLDALIGINLLKPTGQDCAAILDAARLSTLDGTRSPEAKLLARIDVVEKRTVGGHPILYSEVAMRTADEVKWNSSYPCDRRLVIGAVARSVLQLSPYRTFDVIAVSVVFSALLV